MTRLLEIEKCWDCRHYDSGEITLEGYYEGKCTFGGDRTKITEFDNGDGIPNWCPLETKEEIQNKTRKIEINLNDIAIVTLNNIGIKLWSNYYLDIGHNPNEHIHYKFATGDIRSRKLKTELWQLFNIFGYRILAGIKPPFDHNKITIIKKG